MWIEDVKSSFKVKDWVSQQIQCQHREDSIVTIISSRFVILVTFPFTILFSGCALIDYKEQLKHRDWMGWCITAEYCCSHAG